MVTTVQTSPLEEQQVQDSLLSVQHINGAVVIRSRQLETTRPNADPLTQRETQVLSLVAEGSTNKIVAEHLRVCERTVKNHLTSIMTKLRASDRTHDVVTAVRRGWLAI